MGIGEFRLTPDLHPAGESTLVTSGSSESAFRQNQLY